MADQFGSNVEPLLPRNERYAQFKAQQDKVMQQHMAYSKQLEDRQAQVNQRKGDLDIAGRMMKILDSRVPKPARQFLATELAKHVGVDPKSDQVKNVNQMLTSLDPDSLAGLRSTFAGQLQSSSPGQITDTVSGVLSGKVSMDSFIGQVSQAQQQVVSGDAGSDQLSGGAAGDTLAAEPDVKSQDKLTQDQPTAAPAAVPPAPFQPGAPGEISSLEGQRTTHPIEQPASPNIVGALGLDTRLDYRNKDLTHGGFKIPLDLASQDKLAEELNTRTTGISATVNEASKMVDIFENHPETLGTVGQGVSTIQSIIQQVKGALNVINPMIKDDTDPYSMEVQSLAAETGKQLAKIHSIDVTATNAAQLQSMALGLAYKMAIANDIPGNRLTNVIIEQNLRQIGQSASPQQFKAVLANTLESTTREFNESVRRKTGVNGTDIMARQLSQPDLEAMATRVETDTNSMRTDPNGIYLIPEAMRRSLLQEALRRKTGQSAAPEVTPSSPTIQEEQRTLGGAEMQRKSKEIQKQDQDLRIQQQREDRAVRTETRQDTREERVTATGEASAKLAREQFDYSKAEHERDNAFQREKFDYAKQQDRVQMDLHRQEKIAAAFRSFGAAISGSHGGGGSVGVPNLGGGQDVSAFRMNPAPQRVPPRPGGNR
jgi:hypothetical protein